jgi:hypothetical protein
VQDGLDPLFAASITIGKGGSMSAHAAAKPIELQEQGWRTHLIKVINLAEQPEALSEGNPNAGPLPNTPADQVERRWLDLKLYNSRPLKPGLGGLGA